MNEHLFAFLAPDEPSSAWSSNSSQNPWRSTVRPFLVNPACSSEAAASFAVTPMNQRDSPEYRSAAERKILLQYDPTRSSDLSIVDAAGSITLKSGFFVADCSLI